MVMKYKGYVADVELDEEAGVLHGRVINTRDMITFESSTVDDLKREFHASVNSYLQFCQQRGVEPEKPYSGEFVVRVPKSLHRRLATIASIRKQSLNKLVNEYLEREAEREDAEV